MAYLNRSNRANSPVDAPNLMFTFVSCTNIYLLITSFLVIYYYYYCNVILIQEMLPSIRAIAGDVYIFQQDSVPTRRVHQMVKLLQHETPLNSFLQLQGLGIVLILI